MKGKASVSLGFEPRVAGQVEPSGGVANDSSGATGVAPVGSHIAAEVACMSFEMLAPLLWISLELMTFTVCSDF